VLPTNIPDSLHQQTVREIVKISAGGRRVRVVLSNRYGTQPLVIGEVHVAFSSDGAAIVKDSDRVLTFAGRRSVTVPPGAPAVSDPVYLDVAALRKLAVTTYFPQQTPLTTFHWGEQQTGYIASGNVAGAAEIKADSLLKGRAFLCSVLVDAAPHTRTVVAFGDSITDGNGSTPDLNRRWPDFLSERLSQNHVAIANAGISGSRVLGDRMGVNALARFEQDVLSQPGVNTVILLMGINDIGWPDSAFAPNDPAMTAQELIAGYQQLIASARAHNVRIVGATMTPFEGALQGTPLAGHYSVQKDAVRQTINRWIRSSAFDGVVDFDAVTRDPQHPSRLLPAFDSGDHLHPGDAGHKAMADAVDLRTLFGEERLAKRK
jgi:lysophospholipase L1-like esterase